MEELHQIKTQLVVEAGAGGGDFWIHQELEDAGGAGGGGNQLTLEQQELLDGGGGVMDQALPGSSGEAGAGGSGVVIIRESPGSGVTFKCKSRNKHSFMYHQSCSPAGFDQVATFTTSGTFTVAEGGPSVSTEYLVVAGGGAGGPSGAEEQVKAGGGGGAGGFRSSGFVMLLHYKEMLYLYHQDNIFNYNWSRWCCLTGSVPAMAGNGISVFHTMVETSRLVVEGSGGGSDRMRCKHFSRIRRWIRRWKTAEA